MRLISYDGLGAKISLFTLAKSILRHSAKHVLRIKFFTVVAARVQFAARLQRTFNKLCQSHDCLN